MSVVKMGSNYYLQQKPVKEIAQLYGKEVKLKKKIIDSSFSISKAVNFAKAPIEMSLTFDADKLPRKFGVRLKNAANQHITVYCNSKLQQVFVDRTNATGLEINEPYKSIQKAAYVGFGKSITWRLLIDVASLELFAEDGKMVFTDTFYPSQPFDEIEVFAEGGKVVLESGSVRELRSGK